MRITVPFFRAVLGLGLVASLFLGCEQFLGKSEGDKAKADDKVTTAPEDVALQLSIKETEDCKVLRDQVLAAHAAGQAPGALETEFIGKCVVEVKSTAGATVDANIALPPDLVPDGITRCRWIVTQIDGGREELVVKYRFYCPDDCDTMAVRDSVRHVKLCIDPLPKDTVRIPRDTVRIPRDTVYHPTYCDSLRHRLAEVKGDSALFSRVLREFNAKCVVDKPVDSLPRPGLSFCDSLRKHLSILKPETEEYARVKRMLAEKCDIPRDTLKVPVDTHKVAPTECEQILAKLKMVDPNSPDYVRLKTYYGERCVVINPNPGISFCDSLRKHLFTLRPESEEYARVKRMIAEKCEVPRDTIKIPVDTLKVAPKPEPKPLPEPNPKPISNCEAYRMKLASVPPESPDYAYLKDLVAKECAVIVPAK